MEKCRSRWKNCQIKMDDFFRCQHDQVMVISVNYVLRMPFENNSYFVEEKTWYSLASSKNDCYLEKGFLMRCQKYLVMAEWTNFHGKQSNVFFFASPTVFLWL